MNTKLKNAEKRLYRWWRFFQTFLARFVVRRFNINAEICDVEGPCIVVSNHVTSWDPLLLALSFPRKNLHYVASEHIFRLGLFSKFLLWVADPIPRRKATTAADTVMACLRRIRAGGSVCVFAEGDASWNGVTGDILPATGKMVRASGATLITFRLEGGYLSLPRWSKVFRKGKMCGHAVGIYKPEQLKAMKPEEINSVISRDIYEDAWARQEKEHIAYKGSNRAVGIEKGLFMCPKCRSIDSLKGVGDLVRCSCGFNVSFTDEGFFDPPAPFKTFLAWDLWQMDELKNSSPECTEVLFSDDSLTLTRIGNDHKEYELGCGKLEQHKNAIEIAGRRFELKDISGMAMVKANILLFSVADEYYEIRSEAPRCLRKYLAVWKSGKSAVGSIIA